MLGIDKVVELCRFATPETEEELIEGLSFAAFRRVSTSITREVLPGATRQTIPVDPVELTRAQAADMVDP